MTLDADEQDLMKTWDKVLEYAKGTTNYHSDFKYGVYQITKELNTFRQEGTRLGKPVMVPDYVMLNSELENLRVKLKAYYQTHITEKMFKYELLK